MKEVRSAWTEKVIRAAAPGCSSTLQNPASHRCGRTTDASGSERYSWTTSVPATSPTLRTVTATETAPSVAATGSTESSEQVKLVQLSPCPKGNSGVGSTELQSVCPPSLECR